MSERAGHGAMGVATDAGSFLRCPNCGTPVDDASFCPSCGQKQGRLLPGVGEWLGEALDELLFVDGRVPRTLRLLVLRPGALTVEWLEGRRAAFVRPLRLYLGTAVVFFLAWAAFGDRTGGTLAGAVQGFLAGWADGPPGIEDARMAETVDRIAGVIPTVLLVCMVPVLAALSAVAHGGRIPFVAHLVFSLHAHTLAFLLLLALFALGRLPGGYGSFAEGVVLVLVVVHVGIGFRRSFGGGVLSTGFRTAGLAVTYLFTLFLAVAAASLIAGIRP